MMQNLLTSPLDLTGKSAPVTGCNRGVGPGRTPGLAEAGADMVGASATLASDGGSADRYRRGLRGHHQPGSGDRASAAFAAAGCRPVFQKLRRLALLAALVVAAQVAVAQVPTGQWHGKPCAVVLTYDDAIDADLDHVLPALDSAGLRGTFYLIAAAPVVQRRLPEWRGAARRGHELGNHSLFHPCDGRPAGRGFVGPDNDLSTYTLGRATQEIRAANTLLQAIDGQTRRTFAYPCGDLRIGDSLFYRHLRRDFVAARGVLPGLPATPAQVDLDNVPSYLINGQTGEQLIALVRQAQQQHALLVFLFHGVGGGHGLNVSRQAHLQLLRYLQQHQAGIWVAPLVEVAEFVRQRK